MLEVRRPLERCGDGPGLFLDLIFEPLLLRAHRINGFTRTLHVRRLLHAPAYPPGGGGCAPERTRGNHLATEHGAEEGCAERQRGLKLLLRGLFRFPSHRRFRPAEPFDERRLPGLELLPNSLERLIPGGSGGILDPYPELALGFTGR
jgi:hypothetical protein